MNKLLPFYRDTLGLKVGSEAPGFVVLGEPNAPALALGTHSEVHGMAVKSAGVEFIEEPTELPNGSGWITTFKDPEGNNVQLLQFGGM